MATDLTATAGDQGGTSGSGGGGAPRARPVRWVMVGVAVVVLLPLAVILGSRLGEDATLGQRSVLLDKPAPEFTLSNIDGGTISNEDLVGRPYLVNFWASWCVPCRQEHPNLEALYARYEPQGVELLGVMFNDTPAGARAYREELGGDWPLLEDPDERTAVDFGVTGPPETFIVDDAGMIRERIRGAVNAGHLRKIEALFSELGLR